MEAEPEEEEESYFEPHISDRKAFNIWGGGIYGGRRRGGGGGDWMGGWRRRRFRRRRFRRRRWRERSSNGQQAAATIANTLIELYMSSRIR